MVVSTRPTTSEQFGLAEMMSDGNGLWQATPVNSVAQLDVGHSYLAAHLTPDALTIYYQARTTATDDYDLYVASRATAEDLFGTPRVLEASTTDNDGDPWLSRDGCRVYFAVSKAMLSQSDGIWMASRTPAP
jgi:hypothetical protein